MAKKAFKRASSSVWSLNMLPQQSGSRHACSLKPRSPQEMKGSVLTVGKQHTWLTKDSITFSSQAGSCGHGSKASRNRQYAGSVAAAGRTNPVRALKVNLLPHTKKSGSIADLWAVTWDTHLEPQHRLRSTWSSSAGQ